MNHCLVGYDKQTERVVFETPIHDTKAIMTFPPEDPDGVYCYPVTQEAARRFSNLDADYFLEGYGG